MMQELQIVLRVVRGMAAEQLPELLGELELVRTTALLRLTTAASTPSQSTDELLNVAEASERLGVSTDYLYRHSEQFPFTKRVGRKLLFSSVGIDNWIRQRRK